MPRTSFRTALKSSSQRFISQGSGAIKYRFFECRNPPGRLKHAIRVYLFGKLMHLALAKKWADVPRHGVAMVYRKQPSPVFRIKAFAAVNAKNLSFFSESLLARGCLFYKRWRHSPKTQALLTPP